MAAALIRLAIVLLGPMIEALAVRQEWRWFLFKFGPGPTLGQWYGLAMIVKISFAAWELLPYREETMRELTGRQVVVRALVLYGGIGLSLPLSWSVGAIFGWV